MIYVLLSLNIILTGSVLYFVYRIFSKYNEKVEVEKKAVEEKEQLSNQERKFMEGISNVLNYDMNVALKALKGDWSEDA